VNELNPAILLGVVLFLLNQLAPAYFPSLAKALVRGWVWLYTSVLPQEAKERRRMEMASDFWEQMQAERAEGFAPHVAALRVLGRLLPGIPSDLSWSVRNIRLPTLPLRLPPGRPPRLEGRGSVVLKRPVVHATGTVRLSGRLNTTVISGRGGSDAAD
jgi:hypothetical protein